MSTFYLASRRIPSSDGATDRVDLHRAEKGFTGLVRLGPAIRRTNPVKPGEARGSGDSSAGINMHFCNMGRCSIDQAIEIDT
jgi:hypothetical protein